MYLHILYLYIHIRIYSILIYVYMKLYIYIYIYCMVYLMPKPSLQRDSSGTIHPLAIEINGFMPFPNVLI